jgi:hypothetical protein
MGRSAPPPCRCTAHFCTVLPVNSTIRSCAMLIPSPSGSASMRSTASGFCPPTTGNTSIPTIFQASPVI